MPERSRTRSTSASAALRKRRSGSQLLLTILVILLIVVLYALQECGVVDLPIALTEPTLVTDQPVVSSQATEQSADRPVVTAVPGADWYALYFTEPRYPDDPQTHHGGLDERLVELMDRAQRTLDVACYDFDLGNVADAMVRAKARGVVVRMVTDTDTVANDDAQIQSAFQKLKKARIRIVEDKRTAIMHNKFTIVDGEWVSTGSWNYTDGDTYRLNNWMGIFRSKELAANYLAEFEQMVRGDFGGSKQVEVPYPIVRVGQTSIQTCFSPKGDCGDLVSEVIRQKTTQSLQFAAFSFTHDGIAAAMLEKHAQGVRVVGVFETSGSQTPFSEYTKMKQAGLEVYTDGNPYMMHHKMIIIDGRWVIAGSFNFSASADEDNDENLLVLDDPAIARAFQSEFDRILRQAQTASSTQ